MKTSFSLILLLLLYISIESIVQVNAECWEIDNPLKPWKKKVSSKCGTQNDKLAKGKGSDTSSSIVGNGQPLAAKDAFQFDFSCGVPDQVLCKKAENAFKAAGEVIATIINIVTPIKVNATFTDFCKALQECGGEILGAASAARTIPLLDDDNMVRQYPQALAKQFLLSPEPEWGPFDIQAFFNAEASLFFKEDGNIKLNQFDFEYIVTHELVHGLGFASSWNNYFGQLQIFNALTPDPSFLDVVTDINQPVKFTGFEETAFDKYMVNTRSTEPKRMSEFTQQINSFVEIGKDFPSVQELLIDFMNSSEFQITQSLLLDAQTPKTMAFRPQNANSTDDLVFLETNIEPFRVGSSISHVDIVTFNNTPDFLEVFNAKRGQSLDQILASTGGQFPIGPKLKGVLETLGYASADNPNPYKPKLPTDSQTTTVTPKPLPVGTMNNNDNPNMYSSATSLTYSFNILSIFIIMAVTLLF